MKKLFIFTSVILTFVLGVFSVSADTLFVNGDYKFSTSNDQIKILEYLGNDADVVIPEEILGDTVVGIGHMAFSYNDSIKTIIIPSSVTKIDGYAMSYINNLESVVISENCIDLGVGVFQVCPSLKNVEIKSNRIDSYEMLKIINYSKEIYYDHREDWNKMVVRGMKEDFSWDKSAIKYMQLYDKVLGY